jgi:hypothetical protein
MVNASALDAVYFDMKREKEASQARLESKTKN